MEENEAIAILGGRPNEVEEFVTQEVFEFKTKLLMGGILPSVFRKRAEKLKLMSDALIALGFELEVSPVQLSPLQLVSPKKEDLLQLYRSFEQQMSQFKLILMQAIHPNVVAEILLHLAELEHQKLLLIYQVLGHLSSDDSVKMSDYINSGEIIFELKRSNQEIINNTFLNAAPWLKKEISKSAKYYKFVSEKGL